MKTSAPCRKALVLFAILSLFCLGRVAAAKKTVITVWYTWNEPFAKDIVKRFNDANPSIELKLVTSSGGDKLFANIAAGAPPNVILEWNDVIQNYASRGIIRPLDDYVKQRKVNLGEYSPAAVKNVKYKGKVYGVPFDWDPDYALFVNKKVMSQAGMDANRPPKLTTELEDAAAKLTQTGADGKYSRLGWIPWFGWSFYQIYWAQAFGGSFFDDVKDKVSINHPRNVEAYKWLGSYVAKYGYAKLAPLAGYWDSDFWNKGKLGMLTGGAWMVTNTKLGNKNADFDRDYAVYAAPYAPGSKPFMACSGWSFMVPRGAKDLDATYKVIEYLSETKNVIEFCKARSMLPARLKDRSLLAGDPNLGVFVKLTQGLEDAIWMDPSPIMPTIWTQAEQGALTVVQQKKGAKEVLDAAQKVAETELKRALARRLF